MIFVIFFICCLLGSGMVRYGQVCSSMFRYYLPRNLIRFKQYVFFLVRDVEVLPHKNKLDVKQIFSRVRRIAKSDY